MLLTWMQKPPKRRSRTTHPHCSASGRFAEFGRFLQALVNAHPCLKRMTPRPVPVSSPRAVAVPRRDFRG